MFHIHQCANSSLPLLQIRSHSFIGGIFHQGDHCRSCKNGKFSAPHCTGCDFLCYLNRLFSCDTDFHTNFPHFLNFSMCFGFCQI